MSKPPLPTDPRHVAETFISTPLAVFTASGVMHVSLGIERPVAGSGPGVPVQIEREVVVRLVLPRETAVRIANAMLASAGVATGTVSQAVKN